LFDGGPKGLFPLRLHVALRGVAWRAIVRIAGASTRVELSLTIVRLRRRRKFVVLVVGGRAAS